jgi:hypothetical protein
VARVVDEIRQRVDERLAELQPAVDEYHELLAIRRGLDQGAGAAAVADRPARPRREGGRAAEAIRIVSGRPGATVSEIAAEMGINQNYLYRLLPRMESEGRLRRQGRGWAPAGAPVD